MKYSVEYSKAAVRDLDRVWSEVFRASRSYDITERYLNDLMDIVESKSEYPLSGAPLYYEDRFTGYYFVRISCILSSGKRTNSCRQSLVWKKRLYTDSAIRHRSVISEHCTQLLKIMFIDKRFFDFVLCIIGESVDLCLND